MQLDKVISCKLKNRGGWYEVAKVGKWKGHEAGEFELSKSDLNQILTNFQNTKVDLVVDYEHQTLSGKKAPASGWIRYPGGLKIENNTLFAKIEWTKRAKKQIKNKEYRYLSPVLIQNATDSKSGRNIGWHLHSVALTNTPFFTELKAIVAKNIRREEMTKTEELKEQNDKLKKEIKKLKNRLKKLDKQNAKQKVKKAIEAKKITKEQKDWAINYALTDKRGFDDFIKDAKPIIQIPESNQFSASNKPKEKFDVVKLALGEKDG